MFHVYQVVTVEDGIEILTSVPAGRPDTDGRYLEGTVYYKVQEKQKKYLERSLRFKKRISEHKRLGGVPVGQPTGRVVKNKQLKIRNQRHGNYQKTGSIRL